MQNVLMKHTIQSFLVCALLLTSAFSARAQEKFELKDGDFKRTKSVNPDTPEGKLSAIRTSIAQERGKDAEKAADDWILNYPNHPKIDEAYFLRARAKIAQMEYFLALYDLEYLLRSFPDSVYFIPALEEEYKIGMAFSHGMKRKLWGMRIMDAGAEAEELFIRIQERAPKLPISEKAGIALADYYYRISEMRLAAEAYDLFLQNYRDSKWREQAMIRLISANLATFKGPEFDVTGLEEARARLLDFKMEFPAAAERLGTEALLVRIDESIAQSSLVVAMWYERQSLKRSSIYVYKRLIKEHPRSASARKALERLKELNPRLFMESIKEIQLDVPADSKPLESGENPLDGKGTENE